MSKLISILIFICFQAVAQNKVSYLYDNNGNRTQKYFVGYRIAKSETDTLVNPLQDSLPENPQAGQPPVNQSPAEQPRILAMKYGVTVYPNPTADLIMVSIHKPGITEESKAKVYLFDNTGRLLEEKNYVGNEISFDLARSLPGNYHLKVQMENGENLNYQVIKVD